LGRLGGGKKGNSEVNQHSCRATDATDPRKGIASPTGRIRMGGNTEKGGRGGGKKTKESEWPTTQQEKG